MFSTNVCSWKEGMPELFNLPLHKSLLCTYMLACNIASLSVITQKLLFIILWQVSEAQSVLTDWLTEVEQLHNSNKWLLFFRIPKLIMLHEALMSERCDVARIHQEIGLLFHRDETTRQKLHEALEVSWCNSQSTLQIICECNIIHFHFSILCRLLCGSLWVMI